MTKVRGFALMAGSLFLFWALLNGSLAADVLMVGLLASLIIAFFFRDSLSIFSEFRATPSPAGPIRELFRCLARDETKLKLELEKLYYEAIHRDGGI